MTTFMYVSLQQEDRIAQCTLDPATGGLEHHADYAVAGMPAPMAVDPQKRFLFVGRRLAGEFGLTGFAIQPATGHLEQINSVPLGGDPVHISVDRGGNYLLSAYYYQARVGVHGFDAGGTLAVSPIEWRETGIGAHYIQTDPQNRYAFVPHIAEGNHTGVNAIFQFRFDQSSGRLTPNSPDRANPATPEGPRHFCFHPSLHVLYSSNEQGCSVTAYHFNHADGTLERLQTVTTLPKGYGGHNSCSQIQITPSGRFLYAPNRGHNSIAGFAVDPDDGSLTPLGQTATEPIPRAFSLDTSGNFLYAAGLESGNLAAYRVDQDSGGLEPLDVYPVGQGPMWVSIIDL
ncbi:MAG: lactonase family protein [Chloroflexota bacterium]|nr:lactonase family protein [Chloroflexota bacterium]MDE2682772.1 lactonase family protein [Chloroflexota bacterium]